MESEMPSRLALVVDRRNLLVRRSLFRLKQKITGVKRPSSYPYVSGDSFRALADHVHDEIQTFNPADVKSGDIVFVINDKAIDHFKNEHKKIAQPYFLICHNSDTSIDKSIVDYIDEKIIKFYAEDATYAHEKIVPIPIGLENLHFYANGITTIYDKLRKNIEKKPPVRKNKIFYRFNIRTNPTERGPAQDYFSKHPLFETTTYKISPLLHSKKLTTHKFVASPPGHAIESCRTWEALYLKTVPIVKDFISMHYFVSLGLPLWIVKDWKELENLTEQDLASKYDQFMKNARWDALHMDFWINKIKKDQETARATKK